jgi:hypothetical protein
LSPDVYNLLNHTKMVGGGKLFLAFGVMIIY